MQCTGWPVERYEVLIKAGKILSYHDGVPRTLSIGWFAGFVRRHHDLTTRVAQRLSHARNSVTKEGVMKYFFDLVKGCIGFACTASDVYNVDETSFKTKGSTKKLPSLRMELMYLQRSFSEAKVARPPSWRHAQ
ncbi:hypothetical protein B5M09_012586 [Aphanomyces astaci]|uniref:HTH CENPB-type domain-containing protein n=1 Tax=Aphanomyces astaci TaxID=112090 RepID=A0A425C158_APHAT|nr:hypothetical protein B5M09_012586 [Aphanomyces astaci]